VQVKQFFSTLLYREMQNVLHTAQKLLLLPKQIMRMPDMS